MTGSSSTWYAINARVRTSRSSAARFSTSERAKELLRVTDEGVGLLTQQHVVGVDPAPGDADRVDAGGLRGVFHGRDDHRPRVDQGAVEIEEDDREAHALHRSNAFSTGR